MTMNTLRLGCFFEARLVSFFKEQLKSHWVDFNEI